MDITSLSQIIILGEKLFEFKNIKSFKGKFLLSQKSHLFVKLIPLSDWDQQPFFHDEIMRDLGFDEPTSKQVHQFIQGGGKITLNLVGEHLEVHLYGKSTIYGMADYTKIDKNKLIAELSHQLDFPQDLILIDVDH